MTRLRAKPQVLWWLALACLAFLASACGIPVDASAKPLTSAQESLLSGTPQIPGNFKTGSTPFNVYFIRDGLLYPVRRYINSSTLSVNAEATAALAALNIGPSFNELGQGIETAMTQFPRANLRLDSIDQQDQYARVVLDPEFGPGGLFGSALAQAFAQIVYTLTSSVFAGHIDGVEFELNGNIEPAYLPNGSVEFGPTRPSSYAIFAKGAG